MEQGGRGARPGWVEPTGAHRSSPIISWGVLMASHVASSSSAARRWSLAVAVAILGPIWGCGGGVQTEVPPDPVAEARAQNAQDAQKKFMDAKAAKATRGRTGRLSKGDL